MDFPIKKPLFEELPPGCSTNQRSFHHPLSAGKTSSLGDHHPDSMSKKKSADTLEIADLMCICHGILYNVGPPIDN
jgi:hypothetical protein